jgi:hypothetical protein
MAQSGGVLVLTAPGEAEYKALLKRLDAELFRSERFERHDRSLPLYKRKLHAHADWRGDTMRP